MNKVAVELQRERRRTASGDFEGSSDQEKRHMRNDANKRPNRTDRQRFKKETRPSPNQRS